VLGKVLQVYIAKGHKDIHRYIDDTNLPCNAVSAGPTIIEEKVALFYNPASDTRFQALLLRL
jgi:hypothetical protein